MGGAFFFLSALPSAALVIYLMREKEGWKATLKSCAFGLLLGIFLSVLIGTLTMGALAINPTIVISTVIVMVCMAFWLNRRPPERPSNDLRS